MVRTGARVAALQQALLTAGLKPAPPPERPKLADLPDALSREVLGLYRRLGGSTDSPLFRPGPWDLSFRGPLVVELDEELHFNRYRAITLTASWSADLPWTSDYSRFCEMHEDQCTSAGSWGRRWTNASCERMFGAAGKPGDLAELGAPRWKQRALYDALKDLAPLANDGVRLARVCVYDRVEGVSVGDALEGLESAKPSRLMALVEARTA